LVKTAKGGWNEITSTAVVILAPLRRDADDDVEVGENDTTVGVIVIFSEGPASSV
jgi:hypothetical protein